MKIPSTVYILNPYIPHLNDSFVYTMVVKGRKNNLPLTFISNAVKANYWEVKEMGERKNVIDKLFTFKSAGWLEKKTRQGEKENTHLCIKELKH